METRLLIVAAICLIVGAGVGWLLVQRRVQRLGNQVRNLESAVSDLERRMHLQDREHAKEIARLEKEHAETLKQERGAAKEEGRRLGQTEGDRDHIRELTSKESEFEQRLRDERRKAGDEARDQARREFEQQSKLFSVEVRPFYEVIEDSKYFRASREERVGYQYQLLVNGIPAFQPHLIIESTERRARTKDENVDKLADKALQAAQGAIDTYLGGAGTFVKLGKLIRRLPGARK